MIVGMHDAKTQLSRLVKQALEGEEILLASRGEVLVRLTPVLSKTGKRRLGWLKTKGQLVPGWEKKMTTFPITRLTRWRNDPSA